ncbi:hypothetical protein C8R43DRAFT_1014424 [Mycena crocata]|nr:hypothetical protein C8R43DRAFT_1014424 [Mycena crocata]
MSAFFPFSNPPGPFFPDHDSCFGDSSNSSSICHIPTAMMINFLNISSPDHYFDAYCLNPPVDSCAFGYCPNPDVASPAVRVSTYFTTVVSALLVLYSPEDVKSSFFSQLLNVYSLIIASIISISNRNLTKPHTVVALGLSASPFSAYLIIYVIRSMFGNHNRLGSVFGKGMWLNRVAVLMTFPVWISVLVFSTIPSWHFQQSACDQVVSPHIIRLFFLPFIALFDVFPVAGAILLAPFVLSWGLAIYLQRREIWKKHNKKLPWRRMWRKVVDNYPFIQFVTVVFIPHAFWMVNIEIGIAALLAREKFTATYGQLLAIFVTVPPVIQLCLLLPQLPLWFIDLTWVRFLTCRRNKPLVRRRQQRNASELTLPSDGKGGFMESTLYAPFVGPFPSEESIPLRKSPK